MLCSSVTVAAICCTLSAALIDGLEPRPRTKNCCAGPTAREHNGEALRFWCTLVRWSWEGGGVVWQARVRNDPPGNKCKFSSTVKKKKQPCMLMGRQRIKYADSMFSSLRLRTYIVFLFTSVSYAITDYNFPKKYESRESGIPEKSKIIILKIRVFSAISCNVTFNEYRWLFV